MTVITRSGVGAGRGYDLMPTAAGLCVKCRRKMWAHLAHGPDRPVAVSADGTHCEPCARYMRETGGDPRLKKGNPAERVPAEMAEADTTWRAEPLELLCSGIGPEPFYPEPFYDDPQPPVEEREELLETRRYIARELCAYCPVARSCRQAALDRGYEGVWGGRFFRRNTWYDILHPEISGPTIHAGQPRTRDMVERLQRLGYDAAGEPLPALELEAV